MSAYIPVAPDRWAEMVQASAEVGPLRNKVSDLKTELELRQVEIDRLTAENERLRKAGDAMHKELDEFANEWCDKIDGKRKMWDCEKAWIAAKERRGAK